MRGLATRISDHASEVFPVILRASAVPATIHQRESLCRCLAPTPAPPYVRGLAGEWAGPYAGFTSLPIAQTNPASSRATAVTATVSFLPRAESAR
jgi:hypothetical protein